MENKIIKVEGLNEVVEALKYLPIEMQAKVLKSFLAKSGRDFIVKPMKDTLNYSNETEKSIKVVNNPKDKLAVGAGVTSNGYVLRFADLGTKERKKGHYRGKIEGEKQIHPLIEEQIEPIVEFADKELANEINKILERRLKKLKKA